MRMALAEPKMMMHLIDLDVLRMHVIAFHLKIGRAHV